MEAREFVDELKRMMDYLREDTEKVSRAVCSGVRCNDCPLQTNAGCFVSTTSISDLLAVVDVVEKWSAEHPKKTNKEVFLKVFPDAKLYANGLPAFCAYQLGLVDIIGESCDMDCARCWNEEYSGVDVERLRGDKE